MSPRIGSRGCAGRGNATSPTGSASSRTTVASRFSRSAPLDGRAVPYLTMRAFIVGGSNNGSTTSRGERAWGWGAGLAPELGFGIAHWSACRRVYAAPAVRIGAFPNVRLSLVVGFTGGGP